MTNSEYLIKHGLIADFIGDYASVVSGDLDERDFINRYGVVLINGDLRTSVSQWLGALKHSTVYVKLDEVYTTLLAYCAAGKITQSAFTAIAEEIRALERKEFDDEK